MLFEPPKTLRVEKAVFTLELQGLDSCGVDSGAVIFGKLEKQSGLVILLLDIILIINAILEGIFALPLTFRGSSGIFCP